MWIFSKEIGREGYRYLVVGSGGYLIDVGILNILSIMRNNSVFELDSLIIKTISLIFAVSFRYAVNSRWTFVLRN